jgi:hypothetical protein
MVGQVKVGVTEDAMEGSCLKVTGTRGGGMVLMIRRCRVTTNLECRLLQAMHLDAMALFAQQVRTRLEDFKFGPPVSSLIMCCLLLRSVDQGGGRGKVQLAAFTVRFLSFPPLRFELRIRFPFLPST